MSRGISSKKRAARAQAAAKALWYLCLTVGVILLLAGDGLRAPGVGLALTGTAFFRRLREPRRLLSVLKWMVPVMVFLGAYGLLLYLTTPAAGASAALPSVRPLFRVAHLFLRSMGMIFAMFAAEEALLPLALRARAGGYNGGRTALMLGLSYQLVPVFLRSLEGVALAQRARTPLWWCRPSCVMRAASSMFLLSHRLSEELALALSLRLRPGGTPETK